jgi:hypothetical protein
MMYARKISWVKLKYTIHKMLSHATFCNILGFAMDHMTNQKGLR